MKTKRIILYYKLDGKEVHSPDEQAIRRKNDWLDEIQKTVESPEKPKVVKVIYEIFSPEVENQRRFFNGPVIKYYAIQNEDMTHGEPSPAMIKRYREQILDDMLGYDVQLITKKIRQRKSTANFLSTQKWNDFLESLKETHFDPVGYEFPDSEVFWEMAKKHGHDKATQAMIGQLQTRLMHRL